MKICVVGAGYVGLVTAACFADLGNQVINVDHDKKKLAVLKRGRSHFYEPGLDEIIRKNVKLGRLKFLSDLVQGVKASDIIFIAVGTPPRKGGEADLSQLERVTRTIARTMKSYKLVVEKSTVPVQTGESIRRIMQENIRRKVEFDVVSNPEFLREGSAIQDFLYPDRVILGTDSARARTTLKELYKGVGGPVIFTDMNSAELIKHASNSFLAMKISFINAISRICEIVGADVGEVANGMGMDQRIGRSFLSAGIGFGGFCFPKDLSAFIRISEKLGYDFELLKAVQVINSEQRKFFIKKIEDAIPNLSGKRIGVWGLAFKPNTDDMRYAPSLDIVQHLLTRGAKVYAYDPKAYTKARQVLRGIKPAKNPYEACRKSDCLVILTEWRDFREIDLVKIRKMMKTPLVIDGRNIYEPRLMKRNGFRYLSIGRPTK